MRHSIFEGSATAVVTPMNGYEMCIRDRRTGGRSGRGSEGRDKEGD